MQKKAKISTGFDRSFYSADVADVKYSINKLELKNEKREFHTTVCRNVTATSGNKGES